MNKKSIYIVLVILVVFGIYKKAYIPKHTFEIVKSQSGEITKIVNGTGNIGAKDIYKIGSIYGGKVLEFDVNEGDFIKKGTLIAQIDSVDLGDRLDELTQTISKLDSDISSLKIDKKSATAQYQLQEEIYKKNRRLYKKHAISQLDFKKIQTDKEVAKLKVGSIESKINSLKAQSKQIQASKRGLEQRLLRYKIYAPVDGYITKKYISNYQIIMPNQTLIDIVNPKDVWVQTYIDTRKSGDISIGDKATIKLRSGDRLYNGYVANIKPINNSVTYEREVDVKFDRLPIPFYLEEQAIVDINSMKFKNITKIPNKALTIYKEKNGVWIEKDKKVTFKPIHILVYSDKYIATKDLEDGVNLVVPNPKNKPLSNGMSIYTKNKQD
jgi:RND family efflux transporter MFP subunit